MKKTALISDRKKSHQDQNHHHEPRSSSSCAACKLLKRRCGPTCIFAPYFRADEPKKFAKLHKVFGASNVSKLLNEVPEEHRQDTVNSLSYEAEARLRDPVYGCLGPISYLYRRMTQLQEDLAVARARLAALARFAAEEGGGGDGVLVVGGEDDNHMQQLAAVSACNGVQTDGGTCSKVVSFSPNSGCSSSSVDFGQVPLLPL